MKRRELGALGETIAAGRLQRAGLRVVERNARVGRGEIDIVARDGDTFVFVEVRTRMSEAFGAAEESITRRKQAAMAQAAAEYLVQRKLEWADWRFDLVAITLTPDRRLVRYNHIAGALEG
jgi:putative endonuclease